MSELDTIVQDLQARMQAVAEPERAAQMAAYMKTSQPFYGVSSPRRAEVQRAWLKTVPAALVRDQAGFEALVMAIWRLPQRENQYVALATARHFKRFLTPASLPLMRTLAIEGAWWDLIDELSQHLVGTILDKHPQQTWPVLDQWIEDQNLWIRRTALLAQNRRKSRTEQDRLFRYCLARAHETDFFIRKAIGWALREYAYVDANAVRTLLASHPNTFSGLTVREASKHLGKEAEDAGERAEQEAE